MSLIIKFLTPVLLAIQLIDDTLNNCLANKQTLVCHICNFTLISYISKVGLDLLMYASAIILVAVKFQTTQFVISLCFSHPAAFTPPQTQCSASHLLDCCIHLLSLSSIHQVCALWELSAVSWPGWICFPPSQKGWRAHWAGPSTSLSSPSLCRWWQLLCSYGRPGVTAKTTPA